MRIIFSGLAFLFSKKFAAVPIQAIVSVTSAKRIPTSWLMTQSIVLLISAGPFCYPILFNKPKLEKTYAPIWKDIQYTN